MLKKLIRINSKFENMAGLMVSTIDLMPVGIIIADFEGNLLLINKNSLNLLKLKNFILDSPTTPTIYAVTAHLPELNEKIKNLLHSKKNKLTIESVEVKCGPSVKYVKVDAKKMSYGYLFILEDITHLKKIDIAKTDFVYIASHQLRTPITSISWNLELLNEEKTGPLNKKQKELISSINESSQQMILLVNDLLNISRLETGKMLIEKFEINLYSLIQDTIKPIEMYAKANNSVIINKINKKIEINSDPKLLKQIILNFLYNSIRYSKGKNTIVIQADGKSKKENIISVADKGIGIPREEQKNIFNKFFRAQNAINTVTNGSGLGLYIAQLMAKSLGGRIWFKSKENKGSTFYLSIPK